MSEVRISQVLELRDGQGMVVVTQLGWEHAAEHLQSLTGENMGIPLGMVKKVRVPTDWEREHMCRFYLNELDAFPTSYNVLRFVAHMWEATCRFYKGGLDQVVNHYNSDDWSIETFEQYGPLLKSLGYTVVDPALEHPNLRIEGLVHEGKSVVVWYDARNYKVLHAENVAEDFQHQALAASSMLALESKLNGNHTFIDEVIGLVTGKLTAAGIAIKAFYEPDSPHTFTVHQLLRDGVGGHVMAKRKHYTCWTDGEARRRFIWDMRSEGYDQPLCKAMKSLDLTSDLEVIRVE